MGIGDWGLGIGPNPQSPIPNPQSPIPNNNLFDEIMLIYFNKIYFKINFLINYLKFNYQVNEYQ